MEIDWKIVSPAGPALANHTGCLLGNSFYIHGGITKYGSIVPSNKLYRLDMSNGIWDEVRQPGSPALSHHCCVALKDRYMLVIGGWNGHQRSSKVYAFDSVEQKWLFPVDTGFPEGGGLSSHTVNLLATGEILVIGREGSLGSLGQQKKLGSVFLLTGDVETGEFHYIPYTTRTASRSGHTTTIVGNTVYIIGGRDDGLVELHSGYRSDLNVGFLTSMFGKISKRLQPVTKLPPARRHHVAVSGQGALLLHGGETFNGRDREPVGEIYLMTPFPNLMFYKVGDSKVTRACHVVCCSSDGSRVLMHGGIAGKGTVYGDTRELTIQTQENS